MCSLYLNKIINTLKKYVEIRILNIFFSIFILYLNTFFGEKNVFFY